MTASIEEIIDPATKQETAGKAAVSLGAFENAAGFVLRIAQLTAFESFFELFGESEIKIGEFTVLLAISENPGVRQGVIADVLKIKWSNMTKLVRTLEKHELIGRHIPPHDRRSVELFVTDAGRTQIEAVTQHMLDSDRQAFSMLSEKEHRDLLRLVRKVAGWPSSPPQGKGDS
ncbi:MAG: MarR family transcriptional regulator [Hyphomicrobiales bacterium]|nr:MAG: MarR family transcriptional regulator [Hyphomicrobiales bacterium]